MEFCERFYLEKWSLGPPLRCGGTWGGKGGSPEAKLKEKEKRGKTFERQVKKTGIPVLSWDPPSGIEGMRGGVTNG